MLFVSSCVELLIILARVIMSNYSSIICRMGAMLLMHLFLDYRPGTLRDIFRSTVMATLAFSTHAMWCRVFHSRVFSRRVRCLVPRHAHISALKVTQFSQQQCC